MGNICNRGDAKAAEGRRVAARAGKGTAKAPAQAPPPPGAPRAAALDTGALVEPSAAPVGGDLPSPRLLAFEEEEDPVPRHTIAHTFASAVELSSSTYEPRSPWTPPQGKPREPSFYLEDGVETFDADGLRQR